MKLAIDLMGSDDAPKSELDGIKLALATNSNIEVIGFGDEAAIKKYGFTHERLSYVYTTEIIDGSDNAATAFRTKKDASMVRALQSVVDNETDGVLSSGNTGAYITSALFMLGRIKGMKRPVFASTMPTMVAGKKVMFGDLGALVDATSENLEQTAVVLSELAKILLQVENPTVKLLNNGTEDKKGTKVYVETHQLLVQNPKINFVGNIESRYLMDGSCDVIVADGFAGNIALKAYEGMQKNYTTLLKNGLVKNLRTKIGALLIKPALQEMKSALDYESVGGGIIVGVKAPAIKVHGTTNGFQYASAIELTKTLIEKDLINNIGKKIQ